MKVGIDTFACDSGKAGIGTYLIQLLKHISPSGALFEIFGWEFDRYVYGAAAPDLEFVSRCSINGKTASSVWHFLKYPDFAASRNYNVCFFPAAHRLAAFGKSPCFTVGTVHDMAAYWGSRKKRENIGFVPSAILPNALRRLDRVIAVSGWVKQELVELTKVKESRIEVVPNGIDLEAFQPRPRNEESVVLIQPFSFRRPYILCVSRIEHPVKNHIRLIDAFRIFKERTRYPHRLVLAGGDSRGADKVKRAVSASPYRNDIFFTGHFPFSSLPELYSGADIAVFPSMFEGFGQGVLEAMASGVPVACARAASLPETAEHAALYFDPFSSEDMADRMVALTTNRDIYRECRSHGLERVKNFSWDRCAERTLQIIQEIV
ncbi:MAG: glycosyltransferase family 4 protein [Treponema sp.]|jgi:glycosyltransferase involved in cell wall biosynthesis|nr:glycosyltransferase family 4 protein [Treponema sp.]